MVVPVGATEQTSDFASAERKTCAVQFTGTFSSMTLEPNDNFPTKTKSALVLADKDWLVFSKGRWDVIYISEPHIEQAINNILNKTE